MKNQNIIITVLVVTLLGYMGWDMYDSREKTSDLEKTVAEEKMKTQAQLTGEVLLLNQIYEVAKTEGELRIAPFLINEEGRFIFDENKIPKRGEEITLFINNKNN